MIESFLWYATRGAGIVSLILFTIVVCLGVLAVVRWHRPGWPRFLTAEFHGNVALLAVVFLAVHILIAVLDPFTSLGITAALVPFSSPYQQFWLGLGAVAMYLIAALVLTSLVRGHLGQSAWRLVHWLAYAAWPLAVLHGVGTGTDSRATWMLAVNGLCVAAVLAAVVWRLVETDRVAVEREAALPPAAGRR